jgi:hypothetical protein
MAVEQALTWREVRSDFADNDRRGEASRTDVRCSESARRSNIRGHKHHIGDVADLWEMGDAGVFVCAFGESPEMCE